MKRAIIVAIFLSFVVGVGSASAYIASFTATTPAPTPAPNTGGVVLSSPMPSSSVTPTPTPSGTPLAATTTPKPGTTPVAGAVGQTSAGQNQPGASSAPESSGAPSAAENAEQNELVPGTEAVADVRAWVFPLAAIIALLTTIAVLLVALMSLIMSGAPIAFLLDELRSLIDFGLRRKRRVWGVVYDGRTKAPVPYAKVELRGADNRVLEARYADKQGRYGFLVSPASLQQRGVQVSLIAYANGYRFPSVLVTDDPDFIVYDHVYRGGLIQLSGDTLVNFNIPVDPLGATRPVNPQPFLSSIVVGLLDIGFWTGLVIVPLNVILSPSWWSIGLLVLFVVANALRIGQNLYRPFGLVQNARGAGRMPFALVTLLKRDGARTAYAISDERGRYFMTTDPGSYTLKTYTPANVQPMRTNESALTTRRGWIRRTISL